MTAPRDPRTEVWMRIPKAPKYEVSNLGHVRNSTSKKVCSVYLRGISKYKSVNLWTGDTADTRKKIPIYVHTCVASAFLGKRSGDGMVVRHLNGDRFDNRLSNLSVGTNAQNEADKVLHGTALLGEKNPQCKLSAESAQKIIALKDCGISQSEIGEMFGVTRSTVSLIWRNKKWRHLQQPLEMPEVASA